MNRFWASGATAGSSIFVELGNPTSEWGLIRAEFEVTLLDKDDGIIGVVGREGVPGASCCTIYQLPPKSTFFLEQMLPNDGRVAKVEVRTITDWTYWPPIAPDVPKVSTSNVKASSSAFSGAEREWSVRGRVTATGGEGRYNIWVTALFEAPSGFFAVQDVVECVMPGKAYAFDVSTLLAAPKGAKFSEVSGITTSVPPGQPIGC